jgi:RHS repeat-associated protein
VDNGGNRTSKADQLAGVTTNYTYDPIYELLTAMQGTNTTESYSYDPVGNRLSSLSVPSYTYNSSNELTANSNGSYTYDADGNSLTDAVGRSYTWDFENHLTGVTLPGTGGTVSFEYDPFGRRIQKAFTENGTTTTTNYVYDGDNIVETVDQNSNELAKYAQGLGIDEPLAQSAIGTVSYYEQDGLGSVTSLTNSSGAIAQSYTYDSFGNLTASSGTVSNPFQFTGREFDPETGLYYNRARYYDPTVGRFLTEDPIGFGGGSVNLYSYVLDNPTIFTDPFGLWRNTHKPTDPHANTIVCNGQRGIRVQVGDAGTPEQAACLEGCIRAHEEKHRQDALAANPRICKGSKDGIQIGFSNLREQRQDEIAASNVEINCLRQKQKSQCPKCEQTITDRIHQIEAYRDSFEK